MQAAEKPIVRKMGAPTKYTPELLRKAEEYLSAYESLGDPIPSIAGLSQELGIARETLQVWKNDKNKSHLSNILKRLASIQERKLLSGGLNSTMNTTISKLVLSKHGYHDNPSNNQAHSGIQVTINRGSVVLKAEGQTLAIDTAETAQEPVGEHSSAIIEHDPIG